MTQKYSSSHSLKQTCSVLLKTINLVLKID